jgi:hypothetical protein
MEFTFDLNYDQKAMTAMAKAIRTGLQEEQDKRSKIIGWIFIALTVLILLTSKTFGWMQIAACILIAGFAAYLIWQDQVNGWLALRKLPEKMRKGRWLFREDGYFSDTEAGESDYSYHNIFLMVESQGYMMLVFHEGTAHIIDMSTIQGGTAAEFRKLLRRQTSLTIQEA